MIIVETCPKCGHDLVDEVLTVIPPISRKSCSRCGWFWEDEPDRVLRVPFREPGIPYMETPTAVPSLNAQTSEYFDDIPSAYLSKLIAEIQAEDEAILCPWCWDTTKKQPLKHWQLEWGVIDDDFGQPVHPNMIRFCFSCGRSLDDGGDRGGVKPGAK